METIKRLPLEFRGKGDVSDYYYTQVYKHKCNDGNYAYIYEQVDVSAGGYIAGYEVVKPKVSKEKKVEVVDGKPKFLNSETLKEYYPNSESWGINAFTCRTLEKAMEKIKVFDQPEKCEIKYTV